MNTRIARASAAAALTLSITLAGATNAHAADFYTVRTCSTGTGATLRVSNYDKGAGQEYHYGLTTTNARRGNAIWIDGVKVPDWRDGFKYYANQTGSHAFKGVWAGDEIGVYSCTFTF